MTDPKNFRESPWRRRRKRMRTSTFKSNTHCSIHHCDEEPFNVAGPIDDSDEPLKLCRQHLFAALGLAGRLFTDQQISSIIADHRISEVKNRERLKAEQKARAHSRQAGWIYYIRVGDLLKIGYATSVWDRLTSYPPNITVLAIHPGTRELEAHLHRKFRLLLQKGREWYADDGTISDHIGNVRQEFGTPAQQVAAFGAKDCPWDVAA
ncbi:GIY-YIG nuclease family protein [Brevibacterium casei]|uniref:GIY-YIG nuclease family protein n=1 Tax=Brevibacterium casei TaxID=33889 RepID=UPI00223AFB2A|nr:GIY-YIG nuclease family protein [Brevibacterium casei]MCT1446200.1 GIY-YIG nuclease family protein [Brevibacterium casei]